MTKLAEKENQLKLLTQEANKLKEKIDSHKRRVRANILSGQNDARRNGKKIGRPSKWSVNKGDFGVAVSACKQHFGSIRQIARQYKVPYYALYYRVRRDRDKKKVSKLQSVTVNNK